MLITNLLERYGYSLSFSLSLTPFSSSSSSYPLFLFPSLAAGYIAEAGLEFPIYPRLSSKPSSSYFCLPITRITGMNHYAWLKTQDTSTIIEISAGQCTKNLDITPPIPTALTPLAMCSNQTLSLLVQSPVILPFVITL
jgi:hypothetical protein